MFRYALATTCFALAFCANASTIDPASLPEVKRFSNDNKTAVYMSATEALSISASRTQNGTKVLMLDIRSHPEAQYVGVPVGADALISWSNPDITQWDEKRNVLKMQPNPNFVAMVDAELEKAGLTKNDLVILMCRSGDRSSKAADALVKAGYQKVASVVDGLEGDINKNTGLRDINGWRNTPDAKWSLRPTKEYFRGLK